MYFVSTLNRSRWSPVLFILAALAMAMLPFGAVAKMYLAPGGNEGDPVDSNDLGDAGSGTGSNDDDIHDSLGVTPPDEDPDRPILFDFLNVIIVPSRTSVLGFELMFLSVPEAVNAH